MVLASLLPRGLLSLLFPAAGAAAVVSASLLPRGLLSLLLLASLSISLPLCLQSWCLLSLLLSGVSASALALLLFCSSSLSIPASAPLLLSHSRSLLPVSGYAAHGRSPVGPLQLHGYPSSSSLSSQLPSSQLPSSQLASSSGLRSHLSNNLTLHCSWTPTKSPPRTNARKPSPTPHGGNSKIQRCVPLCFRCTSAPLPSAPWSAVCGPV